MPPRGVPVASRHEGKPAMIQSVSADGSGFGATCGDMAKVAPPGGFNGLDASIVLWRE